MKTYHTCCLTATLALSLPLGALAQLIDIGPNETPATTPNSAFYDTIAAMAADSLALQTPEGDGLAKSNSVIYWNGTTFESTASGTPGELKLVDVTPAQSFFKITETAYVGYFGNESGDDNEFLIEAADNPNAPSITEGPILLYDYDAGDKNSTDDPPIANSITLEAGVSQAFVTFTHFNRTKGNLDTQDDPLQFKVFREEKANGAFGFQWLFAIADRVQSFDSDLDDGFFFVQNLQPVPEPTQVALLALLGLGGVLVVRRRLTAK